MGELGTGGRKGEGSSGEEVQGRVLGRGWGREDQEEEDRRGCSEDGNLGTNQEEVQRLPGVI